MQKIPFNDKFRLTQAVLDGIKTQTRRIIPYDIINNIDTLCLLDFNKKPLKEEEKDYNCYQNSDGDFVDARNLARYKIGEEVAIAQNYNDVFHIVSSEIRSVIDKIDCKNKAWSNKMFIKPCLMPHRIKITNVRIERLQEISDEDCMKEGLIKTYNECEHKNVYGFFNGNKTANLTPNWKIEVGFNTPKEAFAYLIDKTCHKGTWENNPWVFVYDFELIK